MIVFDLACSCGCSFEGWFQDREDFENQLAASYLLCPRCGGTRIRKILSPVRFQSTGSTGGLPGGGQAPGAVSPQEAEKALELLQRYVEENFEDVGADLARESLKIHYGVSGPRNIRGVTTEAEEKELKEEGINLLKIPMPVKGEKTN